MAEILVPCKKCNNKVPVSSLKLDFDEKKIICPDCIKNRQVHKQIEKEAYHKEETKEEAPKSDKIRHTCTSCGYKFKIDLETKIPKYCPYCNVRVLSI